MDRKRIMAMWVLASAAGLCSSEATSQARSPKVKNIGSEYANPIEHRAEQVADLVNWLERLVGRYRLVELDANGISQVDVFEKSKAIMDCVGIGHGPGVHCMSGGVPFEGGSRRLGGMDLYGIDPDQGVILTLGVNSNSIAEARAGKLTNGTVKFSGTCAKSTSNAIMIACDREVRMSFVPDGTYLEMTVLTQQRTMPRSGSGAPHRSSNLLQIRATLRWERILDETNEDEPRSR